MMSMGSFSYERNYYWNAPRPNLTAKGIPPLLRLGVP